MSWNAFKDEHYRCRSTCHLIHYQDHNGYLTAFRSLGDTLLMPIDGTDLFSSEKISGPCCSRQTLKNGNTLYRHTAVMLVIVIEVL